MNIHNLFPTPVGMFDLDRSLSKKELSFFQKLERRPNMGNSTSINNFKITRDHKYLSIHILTEIFRNIHESYLAR